VRKRKKVGGFWEKCRWFDSSIAKYSKYFSPFGPELTAEGLQSSA
jgi:hypothetical protein